MRRVASFSDPIDNVNLRRVDRRQRDNRAGCVSDVQARVFRGHATSRGERCDPRIYTGDVGPDGCCAETNYPTMYNLSALQHRCLGAGVPADRLIRTRDMENIRRFLRHALPRAILAGRPAYDVPFLPRDGGRTSAIIELVRERLYPGQDQFKLYLSGAGPDNRDRVVRKMLGTLVARPGGPMGITTVVVGSSWSSEETATGVTAMSYIRRTCILLEIKIGDVPPFRLPSESARWHPDTEQRMTGTNVSACVTNITPRLDIASIRVVTIAHLTIFTALMFSGADVQAWFDDFITGTGAALARHAGHRTVVLFAGADAACKDDIWAACRDAVARHIVPGAAQDGAVTEVDGGTRTFTAAVRYPDGPVVVLAVEYTQAPWVMLPRFLEIAISIG